MNDKLETATLANGCFWCTEAIFKRLKGIESVESGYTGGAMKKPGYEDVSNGTTGHAEAIQVTFDSAVISYDKILDIFFATHDPTTLNRQGADVGTQYRSVIFYHDNTQKKIAEEKKAELGKSGKYNNPLVTKIEPFKAFFKAEEYHQNYYDNNRQSPYCIFVTDPKVQKLLKEFKKEVKEEYLERS